MFFADSVFLKSPERIMALGMIMGLCLLVYNHPHDWEGRVKCSSRPDYALQSTVLPLLFFCLNAEREIKIDIFLPNKSDWEFANNVGIDRDDCYGMEENPKYQLAVIQNNVDRVRLCNYIVG